MVQHGRAFRTVGGDQVIGARRRLHRLHCAHRDYVGIIARRGYGSVAGIVARVVSAIVARGHHHYDARIPSLFHRLVQGIEGVALKNATAQRKIDHPDVVLALQGNGLLNGRNNGAVGGRTVLVKRPKVNDVGVGGDTPERDVTVTARGAASVAGDDARNVRAVAVKVVGGIGRRIEVLAVNNAAGLAAARLRQVKNGVHSAVDYGEAHSRAVLAHAGGNVSPHGRNRVVHRALQRAIQRNVLDVGILADEAGDVALGHGPTVSLDQSKRLAIAGSHALGRIHVGGRRRVVILHHHVYCRAGGHRLQVLRHLRGLRRAPRRR